MAWFTAPSGVTCQCAYDAVGAASLADSYVNEANPGTFNAAPGTAPTWAYGSGWTFNGTTQYLTTGVTPSAGDTWSLLVRFSDRTSTGMMIANAFPGGNAQHGLWFISSGNLRRGNGNALSGLPTPTSGVIGYGGLRGYTDGVDVGGIAAGGAASAAALTIGRYPFGLYIAVKIQAVAIYSGTLTLADVVAITAAMSALPASATAPTMMQHHHAMLANRR